jgi:sugar phosphate isomerase/epimerase
MRFAICNEMFEGWEMERVLGFAAEVGFEAVEIAPFTLAQDARLISDQERSRIRRAAEQAGIAIAGLHWIFVGPQGLYLTSPDAGIQAHTAEYLIALTDLCADLGGVHMVLGSPKQRSLPPDVTYEQAVSYAVEVLRTAAARMQERGVVVGLEPLAPSETDFLTTAAETRRLVDAVAHPNVRMTLDSKAMSSEGRPIPDIIRESRGYVSHFHANDDTKREPGSGSLDFSAMLQALKDIGFEGYASIEVFEIEPDPQTMARRGLQHLRQAWQAT